MGLDEYRRILLVELEKTLAVRAGRPVRMLNAGSGLDPMPLHLLPKYPSLRVCLLDVSEKCLALNRQYLERKLVRQDLERISFVSGNIFSLPFDRESFEVVYNTGVVEHFLDDDRARILKEVARVLTPNGLFLTLNPCARGKLYVHMKQHWERIGRWRYGPEYPVASLVKPLRLAFPSFRLEERNVDFLDSAAMLAQHESPMLALFGRLMIRAARVSALDWVLRGVFGGYLLLSRVTKSE